MLFYVSFLLSDLLFFFGLLWTITILFLLCFKIVFLWSINLSIYLCVCVCVCAAMWTTGEHLPQKVPISWIFLRLLLTITCTQTDKYTRSVLNTCDCTSILELWQYWHKYFDEPSLTPLRPASHFLRMRSRAVWRSCFHGNRDFIVARSFIFT